MMTNTERHTQKLKMLHDTLCQNAILCGALPSATEPTGSRCTIFINTMVMLPMYFYGIARQAAPMTLILELVPLYTLCHMPTYRLLSISRNYDPGCIARK